MGLRARWVVACVPFGERLEEPVPHHLTLPQAAALLCCSEVEVLELVRAGLFDQTPYGIPLAQVAEYLQARGPVGKS